MIQAFTESFGWALIRTKSSNLWEAEFGGCGTLTEKCESVSRQQFALVTNAFTSLSLSQNAFFGGIPCRRECEVLWYWVVGKWVRSVKRQRFDRGRQDLAVRPSQTVGHALLLCAMEEILYGSI